MKNIRQVQVMLTNKIISNLGTHGISMFDIARRELQLLLPILESQNNYMLWAYKEDASFTEFRFVHMNTPESNKMKQVYREDGYTLIEDYGR